MPVQQLHVHDACMVCAWGVHCVCKVCARCVHGSGLQLIDDDELERVSGERDGVEDQRGLGVAAQARVVPARRDEVHRARLRMVRGRVW